MEAFYSSMTSFCFVLMGLWWNVAQARREEWMSKPRVSTLGQAVYLAFLIPGLMSLAAQLSGEVKILWRLVFIVAAVCGVVANIMFIRATNPSQGRGWFHRNPWLVTFIYLLVAVFGAAPELAGSVGLKPLQVEGILLCGLILIGVSFAWETLTEPGEPDPNEPIPNLDVRGMLKPPRVVPPSSKP
jgi:hypothetical protein